MGKFANTNAWPIMWPSIFDFSHFEPVGRADGADGENVLHVAAFEESSHCVCRTRGTYANINARLSFRV